MSRVKNKCSRLCSKYLCIYCNYDFRCRFNNKFCHCFILDGSIFCYYHHNNCSCRFYYWCYLDFLIGIDSPAFCDLNNNTYKLYKFWFK